MKSNVKKAPSDVKDFKGTLKRLMAYLKPERVRFIFILIISAVGVVFTVVSPFLLSLITTELGKALEESRLINFEFITKMVMLATTSYVLGNLFHFLAGFVTARLSNTVAFRMRNQIKNKLSVLPLSYYDGTTKGDILSRVINDVELIVNSLNQSVTAVLTGVFTIIAILIVMTVLNIWLTLVAVVAVPLTMIVAGVIAKKSQKHFVAQQKNLGELNGQVEEIYSGHTVIKLYNREEKSISNFEDVNAKLCKSSTNAQTFSGMIVPLIKFINNLSYVAICFVGAYLVISRGMDLGLIQAFITYSRQFMQPIVQIAEIANIIQSTVASSERVFEILDAKEEIKDIDKLSTLDAVKFLAREGLVEKVKLTDEQIAKLCADENVSSIIQVSAEAIAEILTEEQEQILKTPISTKDVKGEVEFNNVAFSYTEDTELIENMNLTIKPGDNIAIVGPTGAGKTTLVNLLMRFYEIKRGSINIDGVDIRNFTRSDLRNIFGMVLQDTWLFNGSIKDNIAYGKPDATLEEVIVAAKKAHVHHFIQTMPDGYNTILAEDASNISQGQRQLLTIARAILADNKILILDEATSSVDTRTESYIQNAMTAMMEGKTSFVIAHRLSTIKNADIIIVMNKGTVIEHGNHKELLEKGGFYCDLYNSQFNNTQAG